MKLSKLTVMSTFNLYFSMRNELICLWFKLTPLILYIAFFANIVWPKNILSKPSNKELLQIDVGNASFIVSTVYYSVIHPHKRVISIIEL